MKARKPMFRAFRSRNFAAPPQQTLLDILTFS